MRALLLRAWGEEANRDERDLASREYDGVWRHDLDSRCAGCGRFARDDAGESDRRIITLKIEGWTCASCEKGIRRALEAVPGVSRADVSYARGGAIVEVEPGRVRHEQLMQAVAGAGNILSSYRATVVPNGTLTARTAETDGEGSWLWNLFK